MNYKETKCGKYTIRTFENGCKKWYIHGKCHREDGPAVEYSNGYKMWYYQGKKHREDGPAIDFGNKCKEWWIQGNLVYTINKFSGELTNHLSDYKGKLSEAFKKSIIKYELQRN